VDEDYIELSVLAAKCLGIYSAEVRACPLAKDENDH